MTAAAILPLPDRVPKGTPADHVCDLCELPGQLGHYDGTRYKCIGRLCYKCVKELLDEEHYNRIAKRQAEKKQREREGDAAREHNRLTFVAAQEGWDRKQAPDRKETAAVIRLESDAGIRLEILDDQFGADDLSPRAMSALVRDRHGDLWQRMREHRRDLRRQMRAKA